MKINNLYEVEIHEKNIYTYIHCIKSKCNLAPSDLQPLIQQWGFQQYLPFSLRYYTKW